MTSKEAAAIINSLKNKGVPNKFISDFAAGKSFDELEKTISNLWHDTDTKKLKSILIKGEYGVGKTTAAFYVRENAILLENTLFIFISQGTQLNLGKLILTSSEGRSIEPGNVLKEIHKRLGDKENRYNQSADKTESRISTAFDVVASSVGIFGLIIASSAFGAASLLLSPLKNYSRAIKLFFERNKLRDKLLKSGYTFGDKLAISMTIFLSYKKYDKQLAAEILKYLDQVPIVEGFYLLLLILGRAGFARVIIATDEFAILNEIENPLMRLFKSIVDSYTGIAMKSAEAEATNRGRKPLPGVGFVILSSLNDFKNTQEKESFCSCINETLTLDISDLKDYQEVGKKLATIIGKSDEHRTRPNWENELDSIVESGHTNWEEWYIENNKSGNIDPSQNKNKCPFRFGLPILIKYMIGY